MSIFSFKGRSLRSEYWSVNIPIIILTRLSDAIPDEAYESLVFCLFVIVFSILTVWVNLATNTRRCHDLGHSGFWQLIPFYAIWMGFVAGQEEDNEYGISPDKVIE